MNELEKALEADWNVVMKQIIDATKKEAGAIAVELGSDGQERYGCPVCKEWWYGKHNYCHNCGHKMIY